MEIITQPTDSEIIGLFVLLGIMLIGIIAVWFRYGRNDNRASKEWLNRHIDSDGNYRP